MTVVFNFFGGPGTGKSTCATFSFAMAKDDQYNAEYVPEKAKEWAWEKRNVTLTDQFELFKEQTSREKRLFNEAGVVLTDSPIWLSAYYASLGKDTRLGDATKTVIEELCKEHYALAKEQGVIYYDIWLQRVKPYNPKGRFQNETQAKEIDGIMRPYLESLGVEFIECIGKKEMAYDLVKQILDNHPKAKIETN